MDCRLLTLAWQNFVAIHVKKSTKPVEFLMAMIMSTTGLVLLLADSSMSHVQFYEIMQRHVDPIASSISQTALGGILLYALMLSKIKSYPRTEAGEVDRLHDTYFGDNRIYLRLRRNILMLIAGWNCCVAIWFFCASPLIPFWVMPVYFFIQSFWIVLRLRRNEESARRQIREYRDRKRSVELKQAAVEMFSQLSVQTRKGENRDVSSTTGKFSPLGSCISNSSNQAHGLPS